MNAPDYSDIEAAFERIKGRVRRTPCLRTRFIKTPLHGGPLMLKLESLQVTGSFKARGANNAILQLDEAALARGVITASGGNHGLAVAYAAAASGAPAVIYLPERAPAEKADKLRAWGAEVVVEGLDFDDANEAALERAERDGMTYLHPFNHPHVIAGQGTVGREMMKQSPDIDVVLVAIGGGGLISGVATAVKAMKPDVKVIGIEAIGAPTLKNSRDAGELMTLNTIETVANTLAPKRSADLNFSVIERLVDDIVLVSDDDMRAAARWLWFEMGIAAELSGAAALAALQSGAVSFPDDTTVAAIVCGAGSDGIGAI
jgi:threonine dehydratase